MWQQRAGEECPDDECGRVVHSMVPQATICHIQVALDGVNMMMISQWLLNGRSCSIAPCELAHPLVDLVTPAAHLQLLMLLRHLLLPQRPAKHTRNNAV